MGDRKAQADFRDDLSRLDDWIALLEQPADECRRRVWDNGDMDNCGKPVLQGSVCKEHYVEIRSSLLRLLDG